jgi:hypothetical protein
MEQNLRYAKRLMEEVIMKVESWNNEQVVTLWDMDQISLSTVKGRPPL